MAPIDTATLKKSDLPIIWILGGPGSGKGTLCDKIVAKYGFTHVSTGDLLREEVQSGSERGTEAANIMKEGGLVPTEFVLTLLAEKLIKELPNSKGFLIDGYPREKSQGELFEKNIAPANLIIYLEADDSVMVQRLLGRAKTSGRSDDNEETIKKRLQTFHDNNTPIIEAFATKTKKINAIQTPDEVFLETETVIDNILSFK
ncbi:hypothetical protein PGB90_003129 [Kerria lacca]